MDLLWAVLFHDSAERWVGDVPGPTKWWMAQEFAEQLDKLEEDILNKLGVKISLTQDEKKWLQALDKLEGYTFAVEEVNMGNHHLKPIALNFLRSLHQGEVPDEIRGFLEEYSCEPMSATLEEFDDS
jgi:5'-deoxynucleotidase YfbR-like HD superfamily hydrolase